MRSYFGFAAIVLFSISPSISEAAKCSGFSCDGQDPVAMGCSVGAVTVARKVSYATNFNRIFVDLRWSPTCKTNWAKIGYENVTTTYDNNFDNLLEPILNRVLIYRTSAPTGIYAGAVNVAKGVYWSPMVYGDKKCVYARALGFEKNFNLKNINVDISTAIICK